MMIFTALALMTTQPPAPSFGQRMAAARAARRATAAVPGSDPAPAARPRRAPRAPDPERAALMAPINAMLHALETNDGAAILANTLSGGGATVALEGENGQRRVRHLGWPEFVRGLPNDGNRYTERLTSPQVKIDGDIAFVWARYTVRRGRAIQHCGTDLFDLVRDAGQWKVVNVTWSQRTTGCVAARAAAPRPRRGAAAPAPAQ
jgi:hypothetical protein